MKLFGHIVAVFTILWSCSEGRGISDIASKPSEEIPVYTECGGIVDIYDKKPIIIEYINEDGGIKHNLFCVWTLRPVTRLDSFVTSIAVQIETDRNEQNYDGLTLYTWNGTELTGSKLAREGSSAGAGSEGFLTYTTDSSGLSRGFRAYVSAVSANVTGVISTSYHADIHNGSLHYPADDGRNEYDINERRSFVISVPSNNCFYRQTNLTILDVDIETKYDFLQVYTLEPYHSEPVHVLHTTISGTQSGIAANIVTGYPFLLLFYSDDTKGGSGFKLDWFSWEQCTMSHQMLGKKQ